MQPKTSDCLSADLKASKDDILFFQAVVDSGMVDLNRRQYIEDVGSLLVVDDSELNRKLLKRRLEKCGYHVDIATNGFEALQLFREREFDLVLLDIMMPDIDGLQVLQTLRQMYSMSELPVILVTAKASSDDIIDGLERGANDYVTKPVDFPVALARIRTQLRARRAELAHRESEERYALAARGAHDGLWDWNLRSGQLHLSARWHGILGFPEVEANGSNDLWFERVHAEDLRSLRAAIREHLEGKTSCFLHEHRLLDHEGAYRWVSCRGVASFDNDGEAIRLAGSMRDITQVRSSEPLAQSLPEHILQDRLSQAHLRKSHFSDFHYGVLCLHVESLPEIEARLGQRIKRQLLREIVRRIQICIRATDSLSWSQAKGFSILLEGFGTPVSLTSVAQEIQRELERPFTLQGQQEHISVSIGGSLAHAEHGTELACPTEAQRALEKARSFEEHAGCFVFIDGVGSAPPRIPSSSPSLDSASSSVLDLIANPE